MEAGTSQENQETENEEQEKKVPNDIKLSIMAEDLSFHPSREVIAMGLIDGDIKIYSYSSEGSNHELISLNHHKKACRSLRFSADGELLFSGSKDKTIQISDMNVGSVRYTINNAHISPIYKVLPIDNYLVASGDDDGHFKVWDYRIPNCIMKSKQCEEYVSDIIMDSARKILIVSSGEGTITAFNIRAKRMELQSELFESEFLCLASMKHQTKLVAGDGDGVLNVFNWGEWGNISDRFPGHPESVDSMVAISDDVLCTGSMDGKIRGVHILPNRFLGVVGDHGSPVENLSCCKDNKFIASCSMDETIKFWDVSCIKDAEENPNEKPNKKRQNKQLNKSDREDFFAGFGM